MIKKLVLTESDFHKIIENSVKLMIQEELILEDTRIDHTKKIIRLLLGDVYDLDAVVDSENKYVNHDTNTTWLKYFVFKLRHALGMMSNSDYNYLPLAARLAYSQDFRLDLDDKSEGSEEVDMLSKIMNLIKNDNALFQEVNNNPNITYTQLVNRFQQQFEDESTADSEAANKVEVTDNGYEIMKVPDFETAEYYGQFSCSQSKLCYTYDEDIWDNYTKFGENTAYICLRRGWEDVPEVETEGHPYDAYGLSMIFAFISKEGKLVKSNCRWNHHTLGPYINPDVDKAFTETSLAQTVGAPFKSVFIPMPCKSVKLQRLIKAIEKGDNEYLEDIESDEIFIPEGTKKIGDSAFMDFTSLYDITIPNSVTSIGNGAFYSCTSLTSVTIPDSVTSIGEEAFYDCKELVSITIPSSVKRIGINAFKGCYFSTNDFINKSSLDAGKNRCWGASVFNTVINGLFIISFTMVDTNFVELVRAKSNVENVIVPNNVNLIRRYSFNYCRKLTNVTLPNGVIEIGDYAFNFCISLKTINIPDSVGYIGNGAFKGCWHITNITIPNRVKSIQKQTFYDCQRLVSINLPDTITKIGDEAFYSCISLAKITIPNSTTYIGESAFYGCDSLVSIIIPESVKTIKEYAFLSCDNLNTIILKGNFKCIEHGAFSCNDNVTIYVENEQTEQLLKNSDFEGKIEYIK